MSKAFFSAFLGILVTMPGMNLSTGELRMTFSWEELNGGLSLLPVLIGLFAISQIIKDVMRIERKNQCHSHDQKKGDAFLSQRLERASDQSTQIIFTRYHDWHIAGIESQHWVCHRL